MSGYNIEYFLNSFTKRTIENLKFIEDEVEKYDLFEVTQLINSLLGLIIIPVEAYKNTNNINENGLKKLSKEDYDIINDLLDKCKKENRLFSDYPMNYYEEQVKRISVNRFISHLRNAIAHGGNHGIYFYPMSEKEEISTVCKW